MFNHSKIFFLTTLITENCFSKTNFLKFGEVFRFAHSINVYARMLSVDVNTIKDLKGFLANLRSFNFYRVQVDCSQDIETDIT